MGDMQNGMGSGMMWETGNDEDGEGEFDGFTLGDAVSYPEHSSILPVARLIRFIVPASIHDTKADAIRPVLDHKHPSPPYDVESTQQ